MTDGNYSREIQKLFDELRNIRELLTGNGHSGVFDRLSKMERDLHGDEYGNEKGVIKNIREVRSTSTENTRILKQVRLLSITAMVLAVGIIVMHSQDPSWLGDLIKWVLAAL